MTRAKKTAEESVETVEGNTGFVTYKTAEKKSAMFSVLVKGTDVHGEWASDRSCILFQVPADLVEAFDQHWHVQVGNIVKA